MFLDIGNYFLYFSDNDRLVLEFGLADEISAPQPRTFLSNYLRYYRQFHEKVHGLRFV
ncbi:MAG: hypothetical protein R6W72_08580 [Desulfurivibrionaceae bacterium]